MGSQHPFRLTPGQLEARRLLAASLLESGWRPVDVADELGVTRGAVSQWSKRLREEGLQALWRKPHKGRPSYLKPAQWRQLARPLEAGALKAGFPTERWTLPRVAQFIQRRWGVGYHPASLSEPLHRLGFSAHRPRSQARERDEAFIEAWLKRDWPRIKRGLEEAAGRLPSWTRRAARFEPASAPHGRPSALRPRSTA
ncbi:winged helix-turn-helix domain-containing protein [Corallococcus sp. 4LFB]|uniref:winged helix-turn-helix domain-containing protein n=1 Tax=Corallococcus sp. 4LFB TaxID=3383249 RepID=UPI003974A7C3